MKFMLILLSMIFCHITDDYYLQGLLTSLKQKSWWEENAPETLYKNDYIMALLIHSFSWSFLIMLPIIAYSLKSGISLKEWLMIPYFANMVIHYIIDDLKANKRRISLMQDQIMHLMQIGATWAAFMILMMRF